MRDRLKASTKLAVGVAAAQNASTAARLNRAARDKSLTKLGRASASSTRSVAQKVVTVPARRGSGADAGSEKADCRQRTG